MICIMRQAMVSELASTNTTLTTAITVLSTVLNGQTTEAKAFFFRDLPTVPDIDLLKLLAIPYSMVILSTENARWLLCSTIQFSRTTLGMIFSIFSCIKYSWSPFIKLSSRESLLRGWFVIKSMRHFFGFNPNFYFFFQPIR